MSLLPDLRRLDRIAKGDEIVDGNDSLDTEGQLLAALEGRDDLVFTLHYLRKQQVGHLAATMYERIRFTLTQDRTPNLSSLAREKHIPSPEETAVDGNVSLRPTTGRLVEEWPLSL